MDKIYNPKNTEDRIYNNWLDKGYFTAKVDKDKKPFTIVIPPPNITGQLHMGHALNNTIQDIIIRFKRMQGYSTLWLPGTDHASIATEVKIVAKLKEEGIKKEDITREEFLKHAFAWKEQYGGRIVEQLKKLGSSCDWSRLAFTMDEKCSKAVRHVFVKLYDKGLIYKGKKIINWCPDCKTALSDAEVEYEESDSFLWHIRYPFANGKGEIIVATTRPETMLGDTAVAVNPDDKRYKKYSGQKLILPLLNKEIPLIYDGYVEKDFGTGAVKITPAHDPNDFEVGLRHNLEVIKVIGDDGIMNENAGVYKGLTREECRKKIVEDLEKQGYLVKTEPYKHNVGKCYRCRSIVEPSVSEQWFVKMDELAAPAIEVVKEKKIKFIPERFEKTYFNWMENIKDWCISRQLWWGHRIPAYYCQDCGKITVSEEKPEKCRYCSSANLKQDDDVLDTWFSSALWPFSTLGYPDKTEDLKYFYPTNVLVTAYDIIFFWVARMIFSGLEHMKKIPFKEVLIHGIVRDSQGRKMSKSLGNGVDPLTVIDEYGADTLRFSLSMGVAPGGDTRFIKEKVESCRNFMNKIWNASRFVLSNTENIETGKIDENCITDADKWILSKLFVLEKEITDNLNKYEIGLAASKLYDFLWSDFCDWYLELSKPYIYSNDEKKRKTTASVLVYVLKNALKLLHPFIPFITEEIYLALDKNQESIMISKWPEPDKNLYFKKEAENFERVMEIIKSVRNIRAEKGVSFSKTVNLQILAYKKEYENIIKNAVAYIEKLLNCKVEFTESEPQGKFVSQVTFLAGLFIPLGELIDIDEEIKKLNLELEKCESEIQRAEKLLSNQGFVAKAPKQLLDKEKEKLKNYTEMKENIKARIENIKN